MADILKIGDTLDVIRAALDAALPDLSVSVAEDHDHKVLSQPVVLLHLAEIEPNLDEDGHDGKFPCLVHFEVRAVIGARTPQARREIANIAGRIATFVHSNRFGVSWGAAEILLCEPDEFAPNANHFDAWVIEWVHRADLGQAHHFDDGAAPSEVRYSFTPEIGIPNEPQYEELSEDV